VHLQTFRCSFPNDAHTADRAQQPR
jgi:hypothetical protein